MNVKKACFAYERLSENMMKTLNRSVHDRLFTSLSELDMLTIGIVNDMFSERERDEYEWVELATDSDMAAF